MWERRSESAHGHCLGALFSSAKLKAFAVLLLAVIKQRCIAAGAPFWIEGKFPVLVVRPHAPNRDARTVTVRDEYMYRATPNIYIYIYIYVLIYDIKLNWNVMDLILSQGQSRPLQLIFLACFSKPSIAITVAFAYVKAFPHWARKSETNFGRDERRELMLSSCYCYLRTDYSHMFFIQNNISYYSYFASVWVRACSL